jgi:uncharacterized lipoprotein NlpE involved in copper resistance
MKKSVMATAALASVAALTLVGCGAESEAPVVQEAAAVTEVEETPVVEENDDVVVEEAAAEAEVDTSGTAALGDTVRLGDEYGWEITVTKVTKNADDTIAQSEWNDAPSGQYVLVTYDATWVGDKRSSSPDMDLTWEFVGTDGVVYEESYQTTPADEEEWPTEARQGATVTAQALFDVPKKVVNGGLVSVDEWVSGDYAEFEVK